MAILFLMILSEYLFSVPIARRGVAILCLLLEKQRVAILSDVSIKEMGGHRLSYSSILFSHLVLEKPSPSFERDGE